MDKVAQEFLNRKITQVKESILEYEVKYRTISSQVMIAKGKEMEDLMAGQTAARKMLDMLRSELRHAEALAEEVGKGTFEL